MNKLENYNLEKDFLKYIIHKEYYKFLKEELSKYNQHGHTTIFKHSRDVAFNSYKFGRMLERKFNFKLDFESLVDAGYMHDFFMYDWHEKSNWHKLHGFTHPLVAAQNAEKYFNVSNKTLKIIKSHMWPLTITRIPTSREAWILSICDKLVTIYEVFN